MVSSVTQTFLRKWLEIIRKALTITAHGSTPIQTNPVEVAEKVNAGEIIVKVDMVIPGEKVIGKYLQ